MKQSASYGAVNAAPYTRCKLDRTLATMARMGVLFKKHELYLLTPWLAAWRNS